jgi:hypothetical protein
MTDPIDWKNIAVEAQERDPRKFSYGYNSGGSFVLDSVNMFFWFDSVEHLVRHLTEIEPRVFDLEPGVGLEEYQAAVKPALDRVKKEAFSADLLEQLNEAIKEHSVVNWWGTFDQLLKGESEFTRNIIDRFLPEEREGGSVQAEEMDDFIEYLKTCGC